MLGVVVAGQFQAAAARSLLPRRLQEARYMESMPPTTARYWAEAVSGPAVSQTCHVRVLPYPCIFSFFKKQQNLH